MSVVSIAQTFMGAAEKFETKDRARVLDFMSKFLENPASPGLSLERVQRAKDPNMWSARITQSLRAIVHRDGELYTLLHAGKHDEAYRWTEGRVVKKHPKTGVLQIVEESVAVQREFEKEARESTAPALFEAHDDDYLLSLGVPGEWLPAIRQIRDEEQVLVAAERLPEEVAGRLLALASGEFVTPPAPVSPEAPLEASPDNLQRFYVVRDAEDLAEILNKPFVHWLRYLHPTQRSLADGEFNGPVKVTGSAGTGKTVVAMHRARALARRGCRVLVTSYVTTLCKNIDRILSLLCNETERSHITVSTVYSEALRIVRQVEPGCHPANDSDIRELVRKIHGYESSKFDVEFLLAEWNAVLKEQGITRWDAYRDARRVGRGTPLSVVDRKVVWSALGRVLEDLESARKLPWFMVCGRATDLVLSGEIPSPYNAVVVDELQDLTAHGLSFLAALAKPAMGNFMLVGDAGQRIYPGGFSLRRLGIEVRARSRVLRINYRTTDEIRRAADRVVGETCDDLDGGKETRRGTRSVLHGPQPRLEGYATRDGEIDAVVARVQEAVSQGVEPGEIAIFARVGKHLTPLRERLDSDGVPVHVLASNDDLASSRGVNLGTMHRAKGLEFRLVIVTGCSSGMLPLDSVVKKHADPADRKAALELERSLLYVSMTRARDELTVTWTGEPSVFLDPVARTGKEGS